MYEVQTLNTTYRVSNGRVYSTNPKVESGSLFKFSMAPVVGAPWVFKVNDNGYWQAVRTSPVVEVVR